MFDDFLAYLKENGLVQRGDRILVGVSGGIDSVVLLDLFNKLQRKMRVKLAVAHVNYGLRKDSVRDHEFVKELAERFGLMFFEKKVRITGSNIEEQARDVRYAFFNEISKNEGMNKVAVAHHKNDLVETFFLNLSRGSGLKGLVAMKSKSGNLIRPMMFATRAEIESYARNNDIKFVEDVTNKDLSIKRNRMRHKVIPEFEKVNPDFLETLTRQIENLRELNACIMKITEKHYEKIATEKAEKVTLKLALFIKLDPYLQSEVFRMAVEQAKGDLKDISRKNVEDALKLVKSTNGTKEIMLPEGLLVRRVYDKLEVAKVAKNPLKKPKSTRLSFGRETIFGKWSFSIDKSVGKNTSRNKNLVFLDIQKTPTLSVRCRRPGDRIVIADGKTKKLQDIFVDAKIPKVERESYPVVVNSEDKVVWIPGIRVSPLYKVKGGKDLVRLEAKVNEKTN